MSQMPEIRPVVNKEEKREKKKAGFLARLFGGGGESAGLGGLGGEGAGAGGLAGGGGLLATKAGLLALILAGTTVAGGIGMIGYRLFGPGADSTGNGDNLQLFAQKPKDQKKDDGAPKDGTSASLQYLNEANKMPQDPDAAAGDASKNKDGAAGDASASDAKSAGADGAINKMGDAGNGVNKGLLKNVGKFGALTGPGGASGGSGAVANSAAAKPGDLSTAAKKGNLSAFNKPAAAKVAGGARSIASRHFGSAASQGFGVLRDNRGAQSSYAGGRTYDGAATGGGNIGANGTPISGPGTVDAGPGGTQPKSVPGPSTDVKNNTNIPTPPGKPATPWQNSIRAAQALLAIGGLILFIMSKLAPPANALVFHILNAIVGVIAAMIIALGAQIAHGQYAQTLQGGVLAAAGAGLMIAAATAMAQGQGTAGTDAVKAAPAGPGGNPPAVQASPAVPGQSPGGMMGVPYYVWIGGGAALIGLAGTMLMPPKTYPSSDFQNGNPPDSHWFGCRQLPSEKALEKMVA